MMLLMYYVSWWLEKMDMESARKKELEGLGIGSGNLIRWFICSYSSISLNYFCIEIYTLLD